MLAYTKTGRNEEMLEILESAVFGNREAMAGTSELKSILQTIGLTLSEAGVTCGSITRCGRRLDLIYRG